jgi:hypothetical protein
MDNKLTRYEVGEFGHDECYDGLWVRADDAIAALEAAEAENAELLKQMQEMVRMAAEKNRPAYDEQQRVIMELRAELAENAALHDDNMMLKMTCNGLQKLVAKEQEENAALKAQVTRYATGQCVCPANGDPEREHYPGCPHVAALEIAALRARGPVLSEVLAVIKDFREEYPSHKDAETYVDGWVDACNEIEWKLLERAKR